MRLGNGVACWIAVLLDDGLHLVDPVSVADGATSTGGSLLQAVDSAAGFIVRGEPSTLERGACTPSLACSLEGST